LRKHFSDVPPTIEDANDHNPIRFDDVEGDISFDNESPQQLSKLASIRPEQGKLDEFVKMP
jgi:hypothetical protein